MSDKKLRRNNGSVTETAHLKTDLEKYDKNFDKIFEKNKKEESNKVEEKLSKEFYYKHSLFPSDRAKITRVENKIVHYIAMANGLETKTHESTFKKYWNLSKMKVE